MTKQTQDSVLTIILNYRTAEMTLQSAEAALHEMQDVPGEIVIVDNDSGDGSFDHLLMAATDRSWLDDGRVRVLQSGHNGGFGAGNNFGMGTKLSDGSPPAFYYLLNSDAFPQPGAIRKLRDFLQDSPGAGLVGSYVRGVDGEPHRTAFRFPSIAGEFEAAARTGIVSRLLHHTIIAMEMPKAEVQVDWTAGASLMMRRQMIDEIGGFDETFFLYFEETDLCRRAAQAGWRTHYLPDSEVAHVGSASTGMKTWAQAPGYWFDSRQHYFTKTHGRTYAATATLARLAGGLIWQLRRLIQGKPQRDPDHFNRDLIRHSLRAGHKSRPRHTIETRLPPPVPEEPK